LRGEGDDVTREDRVSVSWGALLLDFEGHAFVFGFA
jgi:hypothetical protein